MKKSIYFAIFLLISCQIWAFQTEIVYLEGDVKIKEACGRISEADFGTRLGKGASIITGSDGFAELENEYSHITIDNNTIFALNEQQKDQKKRDILSCPLGLAILKFQKTAGLDLGVQSSSSVAGVRGTELSIMAAQQGNSLITVYSGLVRVEAEGKSLDLEANEAVLTKPGQAPGEKFKVLKGKIDYSTWNKEQMASFEKDPLNSLEMIAKRMQSFQREIDRLLPLYQQKSEELKQNRVDLKQLRQSGDMEGFEKLRKEKTFPLMNEAAGIFLNIRYYALSGLSLRRWVMGSLYLRIKLQSLKTNRELTQTFFQRYTEILNNFEQGILPQLVAADI